MKRVIKWIGDFFVGKKEIIVDKEEIMTILFHRGRMLLLDKVIIMENKVVGEFLVTAEVCEGHEPIPGMPVMRGVEIPEMAFQLLGVLISKHPEMSPLLINKAFAAREIALVKFNGFIVPGDVLTLESGIEVEFDEVESAARIESGKMIAKVNGKKKGIVSSVSLAVFDALKMNPIPKKDSVPTTS
ncbi:hypothetical protein KKE19_01755 [Patescibacteria group bacterium]|nr:hypothetical protein [Patescibacteria group bacterium]MBU4367423.1 hypothetical protein [Patescibacteria group bacterium]MBU4461743.1 hypothetical protein [Patescibacteria group bacterium]MCG2700127.1 hypothetical protein [Candidatus Parcubacteria bacterium]